MKTYSCRQKPIRVYGLPEFEKTGELRRLPDEVIKEVQSLAHLGRRAMGGRVRFRTDSPKITVNVKLETLAPDRAMSIYSCQSVYVFEGCGEDSRYLGIAFPVNYEQKEYSATFNKSEGMEDITVWLPRNELISELSVSIEDDAEICEPTPYRYEKPIVFYGSSITECGSASSVFNGYNSIVASHLDSNFVNLGFSGSAKGELAMAEYIKSLDMSIFVYDYDHNAPNVEHLESTHETFFLRIREANPDLPVVMMTRPAVVYGEDEKKRREVVRKTYNDAVNRGDKNVYFIDGETFFGEKDRYLCTVDKIHPNDLGFYRMACVVEPVIRGILERG